MTRVGALWIGGLEPYMDEKFLTNAMMALGQEGVVSIKVMTNKFTGEPAGYGFINFESDHRAILTMHRLGGKVIPNSNPPVRFKLNHNSTRLLPGEPDTSIWVGDLTPEVDDYALFQFFSHRYQTVRCAKVVLDEAGFSKGYGFVRFGNEGDQQHSLANMTGEQGLGGKPIKVSMANQKNRAAMGGGGMGGMGGPGGPGMGGHHGGHKPPHHQQNGGGGGGGGGGWGGNDSGADNNWPGGAAAAAAAAQNHQWAPSSSSSQSGAGNAAGAGGGGGPGQPPMAAAAAGQPDYSAYYQHYQQYAQQVASQQQQAMAAAWSQWQHQQQHGQ